MWSKKQVQSATQDGINARVYHTEGVQAAYVNEHQLTIEETAALLKYQPAVAGRDVLDIGVGAGRTTRYLAPLAGRYEGIDYSPFMLRALQRAIPGQSVRLADMRDLSPFADKTFDFVMGSNNVIDAVSHDDRFRVLREVARVLRPGGVFMFSAHNRGCLTALRGPSLELHRNPVTQLRLCAHYLRACVNHARVGRYRRLLPEYALLNDRAHEYALLHYYIARDAQARQLDDHGLTLLDTFDRRGLALPAGATAPDCNSLLYVARRR
jgi:SAM-dependent methyltransferase